MAPPPPKNPSSAPISDASDTGVDGTDGEIEAPTGEFTGPASDSAQEIEAGSTNKPPSNPSPSTKVTSASSGIENTAVPYTIPPWSELPVHPFSLEVLKEGTVIDQLDVSEKAAYMFGRVNVCDFVLEHQTISRFHAVLQYKRFSAYLFDLGSTHGTFINKNQVKGKVYTEIHVGDVLRFGHSSRLYIFQGPSELMPPEGDLDRIRKARAKEELFDREASLFRAKKEASLMEGVSWGMAEDAVEEDPEDDAEEITWQTYKGQFTERQEKTRSKIIKRMEKVSNMKKEIDAIRAKDIAQGGLTPGQQMQIGRNEQRIAQIAEELDSLEETLNDSIRESTGARGAKSVGGRAKVTAEEEEYALSDDDEFYDRTNKKKKLPAIKSSEQQLVETADSLLDKIEVISNELKEKRRLLDEETEKIASNEKGNHGEDDLDAYMDGLSSQLVIDRTVQIKKKISDLQAELDRLTYLLRIADPTGEATQKRDVSTVKAQVPKLNQSVPINISRNHQSDENAKQILQKPSLDEAGNLNPAEKSCEMVENTCEDEEKMSSYTILKPQWLGASRKIESEDDHNRSPLANLDVSMPDDFVDYKDRSKFLAPVEEKNLETAAPGLIIRKKRKTAEKAEHGDEKVPRVEEPTSAAAKAETVAADAVALLLKHKRGFHAADESTDNKHNLQIEGESGKANSHQRRVLGPAKPDFLDGSPDYDSWVPPKGQTGDGRTALNDRLGY